MRFTIFHQDAVPQQAGHRVMLGPPTQAFASLDQHQTIGLRTNQHDGIKAGQGELKNITKRRMDRLKRR
jgi:hypothetical protein